MATFTVTNISDSGAGSLREAVALANADADADTIVFDASLAGRTILLGGELAQTNDVTINGDFKADITISGNDATRIMHMTGATTDVALQSLTLTNSYGSGQGGAILAYAAGNRAGSWLALPDN